MRRPPTRRTQPAALARERDPPFVTAVAPYPQKSVRQDSAVEQRSELPPYEARHATSACLGTLDEASEVALYRAEDRGHFRPATHVAPRGRSTRRRGPVHVWRPLANRGPSRARATADVWRAQLASVAHGRATGLAGYGPWAGHRRSHGTRLGARKKHAGKPGAGGYERRALRGAALAMAASRGCAGGSGARSGRDRPGMVTIRGRRRWRDTRGRCGHSRCGSTPRASQGNSESRPGGEGAGGPRAPASTP
jgi:hypothetical protein